MYVINLREQQFRHSHDVHDQCLPAIAEINLTFNDVIAQEPLKA